MKTMKTKSAGPVFHWSAKDPTLADCFRVKFCGTRKSKWGSTNVRAEVTCQRCLAKLAKGAAPKAAPVAKAARAPKLRACDWCNGDGRWGNAGRFHDGAMVGGGDSCDFCPMCKGAGKAVR